MVDLDQAYGNIHSLLSDSLQTAHDIFLHLYELGELLGEIGPEGTTGIAAQGMACSESVMSWKLGSLSHSVIEACVRIGRKGIHVWLTYRSCPCRRVGRPWWMMGEAGRSIGSQYCNNGFED